MKGIILYSDPEDYSPGSITYPDSKYLPEDGVQRGTVLRMKGDPLSNGYPSIGKSDFKPSRKLKLRDFHSALRT